MFAIILVITGIIEILSIVFYFLLFLFSERYNRCFRAFDNQPASGNIRNSKFMSGCRRVVNTARKRLPCCIFRKVCADRRQVTLEPVLYNIGLPGVLPVTVTSVSPTVEPSTDVTGKRRCIRVTDFRNTPNDSGFIGRVKV